MHSKTELFVTPFLTNHLNPVRRILARSNSEHSPYTAECYAKYVRSTCKNFLLFLSGKTYLKSQGKEMKILSEDTKRKIVRMFFNIVKSWNKAIHHELENDIHNAYKEHFPGKGKDHDLIESMRSLHSSRMIATASILLAITSITISILSILIVVIVSA